MTPYGPQAGESYEEAAARLKRERTPEHVKAKQLAEALEREEQKLIAEAQRELEASQPPAEASPSLSPDQVVKRLERLEQQKPGPDGVRRDVGIEGRYLRRDRLRRVQERKAVLAQDARDQDYQKRIRPRVEKLEGEVSAIDAELAAEDQRHAEITEELQAKRSDAAEKISALVKTLGADEAPEDRLQAVMA